jgi:hypothetical protein
MNDKIEQELSAAAVHPDRSGVRAPEMRKT